MAAGLADDLASTLLLATDKPVLVAPAMNVRMWQHPATAANMATLARARRRAWSAPTRARWPAANSARAGMAEPPAILAAIDGPAAGADGPLAGRHVLVTSGPTHEPIDPVRYIANRSQRQAGPCHRRGAGRAGRAGDAGQRPGRARPIPPG